MSLLVFANNATATLAGSITNTALTANLAPGTGALFPNPTTGQYFVARFKDAATGTLDEIVWVTARSGDTITMIRGQEGTVALNWTAGDLFINTWTAGQAATMLQQGQVPFNSLIHIGVDTSGVANTIVSTVTPTVTSYIQGTQYNITIANTVTGATQVNINGLGLIPVKRADGTALTAGDLTAGQEAILVYNGTNMQIANYKPYSGIYLGTDTSVSANTITATVTPTITSYTLGAQYNIKIANTVTGATQVNLNAVGLVSVVRADGTALIQGDLTAGQEAVLVYDGAKMQVANYKLAANIQPILVQNTTYYVNASTGSDSNNGLTALTSFATIQKAVNTISLYNLNNYSVTVNVAAGTYDPVSLLPINGSGTVNFVGNTTTPSNVIIQSALGSAVVGAGIGNGYSFNGFKVICNSANISAGNPGGGFFIAGNSRITLQNINFGACAGFHIGAVDGGQVVLGGGTITISGGSSTNVLGPGCHIYCSAGNVITTGNLPVPSLSPLLTITTAVSFQNFVLSSAGSKIAVYYQAITGASSVTASKFFAELNGVITTSGAGTGYYPGNTAGSLATGGQYN